MMAAVACCKPCMHVLVHMQFPHHAARVRAGTWQSFLDCDACICDETVCHACSLHSIHSTHGTDSCCDADAIERHAAIASWLQWCEFLVMIVSTSVPILRPGRATCMAWHGMQLSMSTVMFMWHSV